MNNKKGFTLTEVILSLAILGIVSIGFLTVAGNYFSFFSRTKEISQDVFKIQQEMEMLIDEVKEGIRKGKTDLTINGKELNLKETDKIWGNLKAGSNGVKIKYFEVEQIYNNKTYTTLISNVKPPVFDPIEIKEVGIKMNRGTNEVPYGYCTGSFSVTGNFKNNGEYRFDHLLNVVEWYISDEMFNMPIPDDEGLRSDLIEDIPGAVYYYPVFPRDYILVKNETIYEFYEFSNREITLSELKDYKGRHIIFVATPGAKSGRIGKQSISNSVFISGIPVTKGLVIHLDASFINPYNENEIIKNENEINVKTWYDISSLCTRKEDQYQHDDAATVPEGKDKPQLLKTEMGESFIGQFMKFDNDNQMLEIKDQNTMNKDIYVFAAVRNNTENLENPRDITFITISGTNQEIEVPVVYGADRVGEWIIIKKSINNAQGNNFEIGGPYADIAEIAVYNSAPSNEEIEEIKNYFLSKYRTNVLVDNGNILIGGIESED